MLTQSLLCPLENGIANRIRDGEAEPQDHLSTLLSCFLLGMKPWLRAQGY